VCKDFLWVLCVILTAQLIEGMSFFVHVLPNLIHEGGIFLLSEAVRKARMDTKFMCKKALDMGGVLDVVCDENGVVLIGNIECFGVFRNLNS